jgi:hypothetical protein
VHRALWLLLEFQIRGWGRYFVRSLRTVRGALLVAVGLVVFGLWIVSVLMTPPSGLSAESIRLYGPALLLLYCGINVLSANTERGIYFTPGEINFLFPGPFSRRELLGYKVVSTLIVSVFTGLLMTLFFRYHAHWLLAAYLGMVLVLTFMQLFTMAISLIISSVGTTLYTRWRKVGLAVLVLLVVLAGYQTLDQVKTDSPMQTLNELLRSGPLWALATPLRWLFEVFLADRLWPDLLQYLGLSLLVNACLLGIVFALDAHFLESSAATSARRYAKIQRMRGRSVGGEEGTPSGKKKHLSIPFLPWWGGIGPIFWRQLTVAGRGLGKLLFILFIISAILIAPFLSVMHADKQSVPLEGLLIMGLVWVAILITPLMPYDFRGDVDRIAVLKTLPLAAWKLALGQLLTPVLLMSSLQGFVLIVVAVLVPPTIPRVAACLLYLLPFNFLLFALENLLFLLFPMRQMANAPGDFQALGRNVLFLFAKVSILGMVVIAALIAGVIAFALARLLTPWPTEVQIWVGILASWPVVLLAGLALIPLIALAFERFDVARDTPP